MLLTVTHRDTACTFIVRDGALWAPSGSSRCVRPCGFVARPCRCQNAWAVTGSGLDETGVLAVQPVEHLAAEGQRILQ
jgi:hypothetical protein